ncbi:MAG: GxxExxY protein [Verrucomicrobiales bacterium]|nr:GxxExxY protein [Verrucomicrobiales bacterium]
MADHGELSYEIVGAAMRVHNSLGPGLREKPYENALIIELKEAKIRAIQQKPYPILHRGKTVGDCIPDITVSSEILVEIKSVENLGDSERAQVLNYLRISGLELGLLINFKGPRLEVERLVRSHF